MSAISKNFLSPVESQEFSECEQVIERGLKNFVEVGNALLKISDKRLYRETHSTFQEYCECKWGMSARRAYQLCEAAEVVTQVAQQEQKTAKKISQSLKPSHAKALSKVPEGKRIEVLEKAASNGKLTERSIAEAAKPPPEVRQTPVVDIAEVAFVEKEEDRLSIAFAQGLSVQQVIEDAERIIALLKAIDDPCPFDDPMDLDELAEGFNECARGLRAIKRQEAA